MLSDVSRSRLNEILYWIRMNPETHNQRQWTSLNNEGRIKKDDEVHINCGTKACLAGHGAFRFAPPETIFYYERLSVPNIGGMSYEQYARDIFVLEYWEAGYLFHEDRTIEELDRFVNDPAFYDAIKEQEMEEDSPCSCGCGQ